MSVNRRDFLKLSTVAGATALSSPSVFAIGKDRPLIPYGVQSGDISNGRGIVWSRTNRPARMIVEWSTTPKFEKVQRVMGPAALPENDFTTTVDLQNLPAGQHIFYRVSYRDLASVNNESHAVLGHFKTAPNLKQDIRFQWSGDTVGQGWGINEDIGGMTIYQIMAKSRPDFFIHSGDNIYADGPVQEKVELADGSVWKNVVTEAKSKVAETLDEYRGNYVYNLMDKNLRHFNAQVPIISQWDDHETLNNWYSNEIIEDDRYQTKSVALLAARSKKAFMEYMPMRLSSDEKERIYRKIPYGPSLDVFVIDMRSYRGDNSANRQAQPSDATDYMGREQIAWLKQGLKDSKATWKVIASDMPIGLMVKDGDNFENSSNGDGPVLGREHEIADLLRFIKHNNVNNTVWLTADVHYTAAHYYNPDKAQFKDFNGFWEFVSGPLNAGTFGPNELDNTFGPELRYVKAPKEGESNLPPSAGMQFYGEVEIDGRTEAMKVMLKDMFGRTLFTQNLDPIA